MSESDPDYRALPTTAEAYLSLHRLAVDVITGTVGGDVTLVLDACEPIDGDTPCVVEGDMLATLRLEAPLNAPQHVLMLVAPSARIARFCGLPPGDDDEGPFGLEAMVAFGDQMGAILESLVQGIDWLPETPRALMDNLGTYDAATTPGAGELPSALMADETTFYRARLTLAHADESVEPCPLTLIIGEQAERGLLGLAQASPLHPAADPQPASARPQGIVEPVPAAAPRPAGPPPAAPQAEAASQPDVRVEAPAFAVLDTRPAVGAHNSIDFISDVPLTITVELGRASLPVREVLTLGTGSIIQLDRLAGEVADILVNNRLVARGQVMIVDDSYGVKITEIVEPAARVGNGSLRFGVA